MVAPDEGLNIGADLAFIHEPAPAVKLRHRTTRTGELLDRQGGPGQSASFERLMGADSEVPHVKMLAKVDRVPHLGKFKVCFINGVFGGVGDRPLVHVFSTWVMSGRSFMRECR